MSDLVRSLITGFLTSIVLLFLVYWFWKLYDRPSKKQLELQEEKREKRKEERMWQAIEAEMEKEREQAEALALICLLYTSPSPRDLSTSRMPSSA